MFMFLTTPLEGLYQDYMLTFAVLLPVFKTIVAKVTKNYSYYYNAITTLTEINTVIIITINFAIMTLQSREPEKKYIFKHFKIVAIILL